MIRQILNRLRHGLADESGDVLLIGALGMVAIVAFAGLAVDIGQVRLEKRRLQALADAAAIAGALEIGNCGSTHACQNMQNAAKQSLIENGYSSSNITVVTQCASSSASGVVLTVNQGPCELSSSNDPNSGNPSYVETEVQASQSATFARVIGLNAFPITVRSEAGQGPSQYCLFTSTSASDQGSGGPTGILMQAGSGAGIDASCGILDDSGSANALESNSGTVTSTEFSVVGGWSPNNGGTFTPRPTTNASPVSDPLSSLTPPTAGSCTQSNLTIGSTTTLSEGTYCGGINMNSGTYTVTLNPGTYVFTGSVNVDSNVTLTGSGVTLYFTSGTLQMNSSSTVQLTAPASGTYEGMVLWQSSNNSSGMDIDSGSNSFFQGAIYLPDATLTLNSSCNTTAEYTIVDANALIVDSGANFKIGNNYSSLSGGSPIKGGPPNLME